MQAKQVFETAVRMEAAGESLYAALSETHSGDERLREFFAFLASEEKDHRITFEQEQKDIPDSGYPEYDAPVAGDLEAFARVFSRNRLADERRNLTDLASAVDFAIRREMDSIFFYTEITNSVPDPQKKSILAIIDQERRHFRELSELRKHIARG
jgi:rubrerythrin